MPDVISRYVAKRVSDYCRPGLKALVKFDNHGLGDMVMFQPLYQRLKQLHPEVEWHLRANIDQHYFDETPDAPVDMIFDIRFPETPGIFSNDKWALSKPEACAVLELGIPWSRELEFTWEPAKWNKDLQLRKDCIGFVYQVNSDPTKGLNTGQAANIWRKIKEAGFTPIEVQFRNPNHNQKNGQAAFVNYTCRDFEPSVENAIAVIKQCRGFVGVNTGTFCMATCLHHGHVLHLYKRHHFSPYYKRIDPVPELDCSDPGHMDYRPLEDYLSSCKESSHPSDTTFNSSV